MASCGGGTGSEADSGRNKTYLTVDATDADGQPLRYQWRVTGGSIDNRNASSTVWTLPDGPGLHFAYVVVSDGSGGYVEQQYAVASDFLNTPPATVSTLAHTPPTVTDPEGALVRLRLQSDVAGLFKPAATTGSALRRTVYLPDVQVQVLKADGSLLFAGTSDLSGELSLPALDAGQNYTVNCSVGGGAFAPCLGLGGGTVASVQTVVPAVAPARNLRLYGHVAFTDGGVCGHQNDFFGLQVAATVTVQSADGGALAQPVHVNRYGDYAVDAAVPVYGPVKARIDCEGYSATLNLPAPADAATGYSAVSPVELSHVIPNRRPQIVKMVANGADGNVRGQMIVAEPGVSSNAAPGPDRFLTYKGRDTKLGSCMYYRALGAAADCDAQGNMVSPISFDAWKRQHKFKPDNGSVAREVSATYINRMDLNLVRRMVATQASATDIAFYVCNHPGPIGDTQREIDSVFDTALQDLKRVACVAMEWTPTPGANGGAPFTKFLTFGPDGQLLQSINLDGRGEKYMPGACVACHGGLRYNGRFPTKGNPSPYLAAGFLPFDTNNHAFGSAGGLSEAEQSAAFKALNKLVVATEPSPDTAVSRLVNGWYASGGNTLDKSYLPPAWQAAEASTPGAADFYRKVIGVSCRTCHASMGPNFDWDSTVLTPARAQAHVCGGSPDLALNASMPNALISRDRVEERVQADPALAALMTTFLGCSAPQPDPIYPQR